MSEDEIGDEEGEAEKRDFAAEERDQKAAERDAVADSRDEIADERDKIADAREDELDARELELDIQADGTGVPPLHGQDDASREAHRRGNSSTLREAARQLRDERSVERRAEDEARKRVQKRRNVDE